MIAEQGGADGASKENETQGSYCNRSTPWAVPRAALTAHQCSQLAERTSVLGSSHGIGKTQPEIVVLFVVCLVFSPTEKEFRAPWIGFIFLLYGDVLTVWEHFIAGGEKWVSAQLSKGKSKKKQKKSICFCVSSCTEVDQAFQNEHPFYPYRYWVWKTLYEEYGLPFTTANYKILSPKSFSLTACWKDASKYAFWV